MRALPHLPLTGRVSRAGFMAALALAPLDFGSTRTVPFHLLVLLVAASGCAWAASLPGPSQPALPWEMMLGGALVAASVLAWELWLPRPSLPDFTLKHFQQISWRWPRSLVPSDRSWTLAWCAAAALAVPALFQLSSEPSTRRGFALVMVACGVAVAVLGLLQNATHARGIYWERGPRMPGAFFGPFYHHTSAGAYLNSVWPLAAGLAADCFRRGSRRLGLFCAAAALAILVAHAGHISRFPQVVAALMILASVLWVRPWRFAGSASPRWGRWMLAGAAVAACAIVLGGRIGDIGSRWSILHASDLAGKGRAVAAVPPEQWDARMRPDLFVPSEHANFILGDRGEAYATAVQAAAERPWFGWGPGGWMAAAAATTRDPFIRTFFQMMQFTHEDFLQTVVEWGLIGAAGWAILVLGAVVRSARALRSRPEFDFVGAGAAVALAAVLTQSLIDFPMQIPAIQMNAVALAALAWSSGSPSAPFPLRA
jgi:O-antigen ligase